MKKYTSFSHPLLVMLIIAGSFQYEAKGQQLESVEGIWSGTVSMDIRADVTTGWSESHISTSFTDNKGHGTVKAESEPTGIYKKIGMGNTACNGQGVAKLIYLKFNFHKQTYRIDVQGPDCSNGPNPNSNHRNDILIADKPLAGSPNLLSGTETTVSQMPGGVGTVTITITWHLARSVDAELIVTPQNYDNWLPEPGRDELTKGSVINISLQLFGRNGQPPTLKAKSFELRLSNTSTEPGITLNAPLVPNNTLPDLRFLPQANTVISASFQFAQVNCSNGVSGEISIGAFDGGGYTTLTAVAILEDKSRMEGHLLITGGETEILIPKRTAGSNIAISWVTANGNPHDLDDKESTAGNPNIGDGLTAYEEYRGVISEGKFRRLDPNEKELGVCVKRAEVALFAEGISWLENASGLKVIHFDETEIGPDRRLNKNFLTAHDYDQYVLKLEKKHVRKNVLGRAEPGPGIPKTVTRVKIDYNQIAQQQQELERQARLQNVQLPYTLEEKVAKTVAHELAHGVNVSHHGNDEILEIDKEVNANDPVRIFLANGNEEITRKYHIAGVVGKSGNQESGDIFCIMNYNPCFDWAVRESNNFFFFYMVPLLPLGNLMCNNKDGTDINATPNYFGDARVGNCLSQIKLRD